MNFSWLAFPLIVLIVVAGISFEKWTDNQIKGLELQLQIEKVKCK